jgi:hypothetical protein
MCTNHHTNMRTNYAYKFAPICAQSTVQPQGIFVRTILHIYTPLPGGVPLERFSSSVATNGAMEKWL